MSSKICLYICRANSIKGADMPAATTPIAILKSLLAQIFNLRIGNMQTYHAIVRAYESCYSCADLKSYEDHLWEALDQTFKKPLENARDLIVVVDGLDEIHVRIPYIAIVLVLTYDREVNRPHNLSSKD